MKELVTAIKTTSSNKNLIKKKQMFPQKVVKKLNMNGIIIN